MKTLTKKEFEQLAFEFSDWTFCELPETVVVGYLTNRTHKKLVFILPDNLDMDVVNQYFIDRTGRDLYDLALYEYCSLAGVEDAVPCSCCDKIILINACGVAEGWETDNQYICVECLTNDEGIRNEYLEHYINNVFDVETFLTQDAYEAAGFQTFYWGILSVFDVNKYPIEKLCNRAHDEGYTEIVISLVLKNEDSAHYCLYVR